MRNLKAFLIIGFFLNVLAQDSTDNITQHGITWTFAEKHAYGLFVNGDYWVVGPVTIIEISPASVVLTAQDNRVINGSMLNPAINFLQGYDSRMMGTEGRCWDAGLNVARPGGNDLSSSNPLIIDSPSSLASGISREIPEEAMNVLTIAVLTILDYVPPANSFRPPFVGSGNKSITHTQSDIRKNLLPKLAMPSGVSATAGEVAAHFEKPWVEHMQDWQKESFCPPGNMPNYGREIASAVSDGALMLMLDVDSTEKELLLIRMIQLGLDYFGMIQSPNGRVNWRADGGHMSGRAFPVIFAGYMLDDQAIINVMTKSGSYAYENGHYEGNLPDDYVHFGEIDQTFYVTARDVERTHLPEWSPDNRGNTPLPYESSDIGMAEWGVCHVHSPLGDNKALEATYRRVNTPSWFGFILSSWILGITELWNHPPLFDYADRWVASGAEQEPGLTDLQKNMWFTYRDDYPSSVINPVKMQDEYAIESFPNPFNPTLRISVTNKVLQEKGSRVRIFDLQGRLVTELICSTNRSVIWDASNQASGIYVIRAKAGECVLAKRVTLLK